MWKTEEQYWEKNGVVADMIDAVTVYNPNDVRDNNKISCRDVDYFVWTDTVCEFTQAL